MRFSLIFQKKIGDVGVVAEKSRHKKATNYSFAISVTCKLRCRRRCFHRKTVRDELFHRPISPTPIVFENAAWILKVLLVCVTHDPENESKLFSNIYPITFLKDSHNKTHLFQFCFQLR